MDCFIDSKILNALQVIQVRMQNKSAGHKPRIQGLRTDVTGGGTIRGQTLKLVIIFLSVFFIACSNRVEEREDYWRILIDKSFQPGMTIEAAELEAEKIGIVLIKDDKGNYLPAHLETIEGSGIVCSHWSISAAIEHFDGKVVSTKVFSSGNCL